MGTRLGSGTGMLPRSRRKVVAAAATGMVVLVSTFAGSVGASPASASEEPVTSVHDSFSGSGDVNDGSPTEFGGGAWQPVNGAWTQSNGTVTTGVGPGANPMLVTDMASSNVDAQLTTTASSGEAIYFRVQDASNWLRVRVSRTPITLSYHATEFEHQDYFTDRQYSYTYREYEILYNRTETQWQDRLFQRQFGGTVYGSWSGWVTFATTACMASAPTLPGNTDTSQYQLGGSSTAGCSSGKRTYSQQVKTRSKTVYPYVWITDGSSPPAGSPATGSSQYVNNGSPYWGSAHSGANAVPVSTRTVFDHVGWSPTPNVAPPSNWTSSTRITTPTVAWWTKASQTLTGYSDPCAYTQGFSYAELSCLPTGQTRQGAPVGEPYWNTIECSGCAERTAADPSIQEDEQYQLILEKSIGGVITQVGSSWDATNVPISGFRVTAEGSTIRLYTGLGDGELMGDFDESALSTATKHGCGLGGGGTLAPAAGLTDCSAKTKGEGAPGAIPCKAQPKLRLAGKYVYAKMTVSCRSDLVGPALLIRAMLHFKNETTGAQVTVNANDAECAKSAGVAPYTCTSDEVRLPNPGGTQHFVAMAGLGQETYYLYAAGGASGDPGSGSDGSAYSCYPKNTDMACPNAVHNW